MANVERMSISVDERRATEIRKLVESGSFKTISAAFEEAATILIQQEAEKTAWWAETIRRCDDAANNPEQMMGAVAFFDAVRADIAAIANSSTRKK